MGGRIKGTKTHEIRDADLTPHLIVTLRQHVTALRVAALKGAAASLRWIFTRRDGAPMDKDHTAAVFRTLLKSTGLPTYRVYDCRHSYASLLLAEGAPITYVAHQLGHARPATTLRYYAKWVPTKGKRWVAVLDRRVAGSGLERNVEPETGTTAEMA